MAITNVIDGVSEAVDLASATAFEITEATPILADNFEVGEIARVYRLGPSGEYKPATNKDGWIVLSWAPNMVLLEAPGTYKIDKTVTDGLGYVGYGS
jgi:hypothetical protein